MQQSCDSVGSNLGRLWGPLGNSTHMVELSPTLHSTGVAAILFLWPLGRTHPLSFICTPLTTHYTLTRGQGFCGPQVVGTSRRSPAGKHLLYVPCRPASSPAGTCS